jgi:hypothetical protein
MMIFVRTSKLIAEFNKILAVKLAHELGNDTGAEDLLRYFVTVIVRDVLRGDHLP